MGPWFRILAFIAVFGTGCRAAVEADLKSLVQRAFELHQKGEFAQALPLLHRAYALEPGDYFVNLLLGIDSLRTGEPKAAVPFLKKASRLRPKEEFPLDYLGEAYARQDLYGEAAEAYIKAVRVAPASAESSVAFVDFALTRFAGMSELMRSSRPGLAAEYRLRALALGSDHASRVSLLQRAADLDPAASGIWSDLALAMLAQNNLTGAEDCVHKALEADPNDQAALIADARLAAQKSDWRRAIGRLNEIAQRSPALLSQAMGTWPEQLQPPASLMVAGPAAKFLSCVRDSRKACDLGAVNKTSSNSMSVLYREQRW